MAQETLPLTDEERAELEELRAEKARREELERARQEREELERLRAERTTSPRAASTDAERERALLDAAARERGRKLMEPGDDLSMPLGQKVVLIVVALICIFVVLAMFVFPK